MDAESPRLPCATSAFDDAHRHEWRQLLLAIEQRIMLARKHRGMLVGLSDVLFERSTGRIGSLTTLVSRACQRRQTYSGEAGTKL